MDRINRLIKKPFTRCKYETLPVIYQGECKEIPDDVWEDIVRESEAADGEHKSV